MLFHLGDKYYWKNKNKNIASDKEDERRKKLKKPKIRKLSLKSIGKVIDKKLISDGRGHIFIWDPRYRKRNPEKACQEQESLNSKFGNANGMEKSKNFITVRGTLRKFVILLYILDDLGKMI